MKIDMHCHTSERSDCSGMTEEQLIQESIQSGLDGIVITDHDQNVGETHREMLNLKYAPFRIFSGVEIREKHTGEDILVIGIPAPLWHKMSFSYEELWQFSKQNNGFMILAHPYRWTNTVQLPVHTHPPDAVEIRSGNILRHLWGKIEDLATSLSVVGVGNSDAHSTQMVGVYYSQFHRRIASNEDLVSALRKKDFILGENTEKIAAINRERFQQEEIIRRMISAGKTVTDYQRETGGSPAWFDHVLRGISNQI